MSKSRTPSVPDQHASTAEVSAFLDQARQLQRQTDPGRLLFALDATASRQPTWDQACALQARMFLATRRLNHLSIQLCYYRGIDEFRALPWLENSDLIRERMLGVSCLGGYTQLERLLRHAIREHRRTPVQALVFVGDAMEEDGAVLLRLAGELGLRGLPAFVFQEGRDERAAGVFAQIARLSHGAHCQFDERSEQQLLELLTGVAVYASGGREALQRLQAPGARQLLAKLGES